MRTLAVMQPYFFPYLGTYRLAMAADDYVFFDDVAFIKKGYIHRNSIALEGRAHAFSIPVRDASQNRSIRDHHYTGEWGPFLKLLRAAYRKAPQFEQVMPLVESIVLDPDENVARKNAASMRGVFGYLDLARSWAWSSDRPAPGLRAEQRILDLCRRAGADRYVNAAGGRDLYDPASFEAAGVALRFLGGEPAAYEQGHGGPHVPNLSMIDVLMHCDRPTVVTMLRGFSVQP